MIEPQLPGDLLRRFPIQIVQLKPHSLINEYELLAIRRPIRAVAESRAELGENFLLARAVAGAQRQLILAGAIGEIGDEFAVGRPGGESLGDAGTAGEIA